MSVLVMDVPKNTPNLFCHVHFANRVMSRATFGCHLQSMVIMNRNYNNRNEMKFVVGCMCGQKYRMGVNTASYRET